MDSKIQLTTLISTGTSAAVASAASRSSGSLGLNVALSGTGGGLVDGLDGGNWLVLARVVVACIRDTRSAWFQLRAKDNMWLRKFNGYPKRTVSGSSRGLAARKVRTKEGETVLQEKTVSFDINKRMIETDAESSLLETR